MPGGIMTLLGAVGAMLAALQVAIPTDSSTMVRGVLGAVNAGLVYYLGQTNKGTTPQPDQKITVKVVPPTTPNNE